jgi:hypothetical protein
MFLPEQWVYTDGDDIKNQPHLGAAVIHVPTCTIIYIDTRGTNETRTIMRADMVAIYTALDNFATHEWVGIFTDFLSNLHAIRHRYTNAGTHGPQHYHHHVLLLRGMTDLLEERRRHGFRTTLHKLRANTNIRGNNLTDAAAKLVVTQYDSLTEGGGLKTQGRYREGGTAPPKLGHVYYKTPDTPCASWDKGTDNHHIAPAVVVDFKRGALANARFKAPIKKTLT